MSKIKSIKNVIPIYEGNQVDIPWPDENHKADSKNDGNKMTNPIKYERNIMQLKCINNYE